ncbi:ankyrin repeat-containing protein At5g02620-like [Cannabis sativa]|uniref:ankyrin repeat-containing protein At5g02620-like n=1 Tax=Cannabis sativa TaxID=3483 RepID=UPI0029CA5862|nr:ankyrin repeat-containing protein At5g02620-like [Cannabis sativa]
MSGLVQLLKSSLTRLEEQQYFSFIQIITNPFFGWFHEEYSQKIESLDPLEITCGQENNIFHVAVKYTANPRADPIQTWLREYSLLAFQPNNKGDTPLHVAAKLGNKSFGAVLIEHAKRVVEGHNYESYRDLLRKVNYVKENTALHEAVFNGHFEIAKLLIEEDPSLTCFENKDGESPLFLAVEGRFYDIASIILDTYPNCSLLGRKGMNVMHAAAIRSCTKVETLLLSRSVTRGFDDFVKKLLERCGSQILEKSEDEFGWMPHHYTANNGQSRLVRLFLEAKKCIAYIKDKQGMTALHISARMGHVGVMRALMEKCPDIGELLDNRDRTALHIAVEHKQSFVVNTLLSMRPFVNLINEQDNEGNTALHVAAMDGYSRIFKCLVSNQNINKRIINKMGMTAFDIARKSAILGYGCLAEAFIVSRMNKKGQLVQSLQKDAIDERRREETQLTITHNHQSGHNNNSDDDDDEDHQHIQHMHTLTLMVSTLIAGITFQVGITMPAAGKYNTPKGLETFEKFMQFNSLAFSLSSFNMFLHFIVSTLSNKFLRGRQYKRFISIATIPIIFSSVIAFICAFSMGTETLMHEKKELNSFIDKNSNMFRDILTTSPGAVVLAAIIYTWYNRLF